MRALNPKRHVRHTLGHEPGRGRLRFKTAGKLLLKLVEKPPERFGSLLVVKLKGAGEAFRK